MVITGVNQITFGQDSILPHIKTTFLQLKNTADSSRLKIKWQQPSARIKLSKPDKWVRLTGGYTTYLFNHRTNVDTPFAEKNISQHNISGSLGVTVAGIIPLNIVYWSRQSNSQVFRDITDVQVSFNRNAFRSQVQALVKKHLLALAPRIEDSLLEKLYRVRETDLLDMDKWLRNPFTMQQLIEANETLNVPRISYDVSLPDSINEKRADSLRKKAAAFIGLYKETQVKYEARKQQVDSLKGLYDKNITRIQKYRQLINADWSGADAIGKLKNELGKLDAPGVELPPKYEWLMGIRNFNAGRVPVNHSELTARNISIKGVNFEYNSWYYLALTAGVVDYRFRDFALRGTVRTPQYLYMVRAGIGNIEKDHIILSAFRGKKQLFASGTGGNNSLSSIDVTGISLEGRLRLNKYVYATGELAQSIAPDYRVLPPEKDKPFRLTDKVSKGMSLKIHSYFPATGTRLEGMYKYTGANFQSFSSFQTNAALRSWNVRGEQYFLKRKIKLVAALKNNEFSNPYLVQNYSSSTVFKSLSATVKVKKWPVVSAGYLPMSQLTRLNDQLIESRFQTLNLNIYHTYKLAQMPLASTVIYNKFFNRNSDPGFLYYDATSIFFSQSLFFRLFTAGLSVSHTGNGTYQLNVMDESIQVNIGKRGTLGGGAKINNLKNAGTKMGGYLNASIRIGRQDVLYLSYEKSFLPGYVAGLIRNDIANIQFTKNFSFR